MTRNKVLAAAGAVAVALGAGAVWAVGSRMPALRAHGPFGHFGGFAVQHVIDDLGLSEQQTAQIKSILRSHREEFRGIMGELRTVHEGVRKAADQEAIDETAIRQRVGEALQPLGDLAVLHARVHQEVAAVLTPEQRRKAEALHEKWRGRREEMHEHMREWADEFLEGRS